MRIHIQGIQCMLNEESDQDEAFLKYKGKRIWPDHGRYHKMNSSERSEVDVIIDHDISEDLDIELWDWDLLSRNDLIGTFHMHVTEDDYGNYSTPLKVAHVGSTASYMLYWEILKD